MYNQKFNSVKNIPADLVGIGKLTETTKLLQEKLFSTPVYLRNLEEN